MTTRYIPITALNMHSEIRIDTMGDETLVTVYNCKIEHLDLLIMQLEDLKAEQAPNPVNNLIEYDENDEPKAMVAVMGKKVDPTAWYKNALAKVAAQPTQKHNLPLSEALPDPVMPQPRKGIHTINVIGVASKQRKNYGGVKNPNMNADIIKGESIRIYGISDSLHKWDKEAQKSTYYKVAYDRTFKIGDRVEYGSYNFAYTGRITAIGEKTVKIDDGYDISIRSKQTQLSIEEFIRRNWDLDLAKIAEE